MTTELEREFFNTFGIESEINYVCDKRPCKKGLLKTCADIGCSHLYDTREDYPDITAEKLLEMICIYSKYTIFCLPINAGDFEEKWTYEKLKNYILKELICLYKANIYNTNQKLQGEIKQLFSET